MLIYFLSFFFANSCKTDVDFFTYRIYLLSYSTEISSQKKSWIQIYRATKNVFRVLSYKFKAAV